MNVGTIVILLLITFDSIVILDVMYKYTILILQVLARIEERLMDVELEVLDIAIRQVKTK